MEMKYPGWVDVYNGGEVFVNPDNVRLIRSVPNTIYTTVEFSNELSVTFDVNVHDVRKALEDAYRT